MRTRACNPLAKLRAADAIVAIGEPLSYHSPQGDADERVSGFFSQPAATLRPSGVLASDVIVRGETSLRSGLHLYT
jgi:hypothetical protein